MIKESMSISGNGAIDAEDLNDLQLRFYEMFISAFETEKDTIEISQTELEEFRRFSSCLKDASMKKTVNGEGFPKLTITIGNFLQVIVLKDEITIKNCFGDKILEPLIRSEQTNEKIVNTLIKFIFSNVKEIETKQGQQFALTREKLYKMTNNQIKIPFATTELVEVNESGVITKTYDVDESGVITKTYDVDEIKNAFDDNEIEDD